MIVCSLNSYYLIYIFLIYNVIFNQLTLQRDYIFK